ncbi:NADPH-dependent F420 reductase [Streptomyces sp. NPDC127033]|uniref:NADPH-dependent F420 reductase n=1 Tax=Streptomyces sp. NPDC127033 TaxID=3347110 RepID=UPI003648A969
MTLYKIAVIGGTGPQGKGLAYRFAKAGHTVVIGSRSAGRAQETADGIADRIGVAGLVGGADNAAAAEAADIVLLAVPYRGHAELVASLAARLVGKVLISCVNPLGFDERGPYGLDPADGSAAEEALRLAPGARLAGAFHHVSAVSLWGRSPVLDHEDVLVCGDDEQAKDVACELARAVTGRPGIDAGPLRLARHLEPLTATLISVNKRYKVRSGLRITGLEQTFGAGGMTAPFPA